MKKLILLLTITSSIFTACSKKDDPQPKDLCDPITIHDSIMVYDTVYTTSSDLIGLWSCYHMETQINGVAGSTSEDVGIFNFTSTTLDKDLDHNGSYEVSDAVTYGSSYMQVHYSQGTQLYAIERVGSEYRLTRQYNQTQTQVWFLKK